MKIENQGTGKKVRPAALSQGCLNFKLGRPQPLIMTVAAIVREDAESRWHAFARQTDHDLLFAPYHVDPSLLLL